MRARKIDANLPAIADAAERAGFLVHRTNADWDLTVQLHGVNELWEVKNRKGKNKLTETQVKLLGKGWKIHRVDCIEDVTARRNVIQHRLALEVRGE